MMLELILVMATTLGLSESFEPRFPEDPQMIYTVQFQYQGVKVGLDWKNRNLVVPRVCRKSSASQRPQCQLAALKWLEAECDYLSDIKRPTGTQRELGQAVCTGANALDEMLQARRIANR